MGLLDFKPVKMKSLKLKTPRLKGMEFSRTKEGRVRIPAKRKKEVREKYKYTCAYPRCKIKNPLDIHHKNMKSHDNRLANLELLCPTHHRIRHQKAFRKVVGTDPFTGKKRKRLVKKKPKTKKKKVRIKRTSKLFPW